jgi:hypothetical protein
MVSNRENEIVRTPNHALKRTATRLAFTFCVAKIFRFERCAFPVAVAQLVLVRP